MYLLVIDDDPSYRLSLSSHLQRHHLVDTVATGKDGLQQVLHTPYDAIILDVTLPDISGVELCRNIRRHSQQIGVLALSGLSQVFHKLELLEAGADDYVVKPCSLAELEARVRAVLRRHEKQPGGLYTFGDLILDTEQHQLTRDGRSITLTKTECTLLEILMLHAGRVVPRQRIIDQLWSNLLSSDNTLDVHIRKLRKKIDVPFPTPYLHTVRGVGYKIAQ